MMFHNVLRVFHDVLLVGHDVSLVVHNVSQCLTCVSWCFSMFNNVLWCLASRATIGITASAAADRLRHRYNAAGIGNNSAEIGDDAAGIVDIAANVISCYTPSWMGTGVTLFLEDNFQRGLQPPLLYVTDSQPLWCHSCYINNTVAPLEKPPSHNSGLYWICLKLCRF